MTGERIFCKLCKYYYVTWNPKMPNGCKKWGIKSLALPSVIIKKSTGQDCPYYANKKK